jgi:hypothetical protein
MVLIMIHGLIVVGISCFPTKPDITDSIRAPQTIALRSRMPLSTMIPDVDTIFNLQYVLFPIIKLQDFSKPLIP